MLEHELNLRLTLSNGNINYFRMWWSDNPPADENNPGCIGMSVFDEHMLEIDGGELDYENDSTELRDMISKCIDFMDLDVVEIKETSMWKVFKKG